MDVTAEDIRRHYESLSDEALLEIDPEELVELARNCHSEEIARRGLSEEPGVGEPSTSTGEPEPAAPEDLVCIVEYDHMDEADLVRGLLEAAEIPASLETEPDVVRLMVPASLTEQAISMLAAPLSDEELAAQAEAAGHPGYEPEEEEPEADFEDAPNP